MIIPSAISHNDQELKDSRKKITTSNACPEEIVILDYINGTLRKEDRDALNQHLSECRRCLDIIASYEKCSSNSESELTAESPKIWQDAIKAKIAIELKKT